MAETSRLLLRLHGSVLDTYQEPQSEAERQGRNVASIGFGSASRIILDVVEHDGEDTGLVMPICCFYSIRAARRRIQEGNGFLGDRRLSREIDVLLHAEEKYRQAWIF